MEYAKIKHNIAVLRDPTREIKKLDLSNSQIPPAIFKEIVQALCVNDTVVYLTLENTNVSLHSAGWLEALLAKNNSINILDLSNTNLAEGLANINAGLTQNKSVAILILSNNTLPDTLVIDLFRALKYSQVTALDLSHTTFLSQGGYRELVALLEENKTLKSLSISNNGLTGAEVMHLINMDITSTLQHLDLSKNNFDLTDALAALERNNSLLSLDLSHNILGVRGVQVLANSLIHNLSLEALNLTETGISEQDLDLLEKNLELNLTLANIGLAGNGIAEGRIKALNEKLQQKVADFLESDSEKN